MYVGRLTHYAANKLLEHLVGKTSWTMPTMYLGLSSTDPTPAGTGITEPSGGGYSRLQTADTDWNTASSSQITNATDLTMASATADWGEMKYWFGADASSGGNVLVYGRLGWVPTTLNEDLTATDTTITVVDASGMPTAGTVIIESEEITYTGVSGNDLTGCTRGANGTTAAAHAKGHKVFVIRHRTILNGDTPRFKAGSLVIELS